ncbi:unnamed protein product [Dracunculus medinensis]|uniref:ANK_REP_REGION domain-containing protein n=1 Tax=Dracunculus medinensis TaxID=318479 RepID=A0A0N4U249_DRAME|nr:unnamed protein product [Dracunculus medinensis]
MINAGIVLYILSHISLSPDIVDDGEVTALQIAAACGFTTMMEILISFAANIEIPVAPHHSCRNGKLAAVEFLLENEAII